MRKLTIVTLILLLILVGVAATQGAAASEMPTIGLELIADELTSPVALEEPPDGSGRRFIVDQVGQIWILMPDGNVLNQPFLDIADRMVELNPSYDERGLLGLAFHPNYATNGRFFVYYSAPLRDGAPPDFDHTSHLSEFMVSATDPNQADPDSEQILLQVDQPQSNHNAGTLEFGPDDGYLYISLGDGGGAGDLGLGHVEDWYEQNAGGNGQDIEQNLLGSILRIDVDGGSPYAIPPDNPFIGLTPFPEQWAYGFRNPYRFSFDMGGNHAMYVGDAGQAMLEEVSVVEAGGNYGWNVKEGTSCFNAADFDDPLDSCPNSVGAGHPDEGAPLIEPVLEFLNSNQPGGLGLVVVGGYVYRGDDVPQLRGRYLFGTWSQGEEEENGEVHLPGAIFLAKPRNQPGLWPFQKVNISNLPDQELQHFLLSFGQDLNGEVYVLTTDEHGPTGNTGKVYRIIRPGNR